MGMGNTNDGDKRAFNDRFYGSLPPKNHINIMYILGMVPKDVKEELTEMTKNADTIHKAAETVDYIIDLYHMLMDSRNIMDPQKDIVLAKTMISGISDTLYQKNGQVTLNILHGASELIRNSDFKKKILRDEIVLNIESARKRFKKEMVLPVDSINVIVNMLNQLELIEFN
jgi:ribonucleotide reductase beta subunit family protein with ferritin-like domain